MDFNFYSDDIKTLQDSILVHELSDSIDTSHKAYMYSSKVEDKKEELDGVEIKLREYRQKWN
jgi:hypothetical protein